MATLLADHAPRSVMPVDRAGVDLAELPEDRLADRRVAVRVLVDPRGAEAFLDLLDHDPVLDMPRRHNLVDHPLGNFCCCGNSTGTTLGISGLT